MQWFMFSLILRLCLPGYSMRYDQRLWCRAKMCSSRYDLHDSTSKARKVDFFISLFQDIFCHMSLLFDGRRSAGNAALLDKHVAICQKALNVWSGVAG